MKFHNVYAEKDVFLQPQTVTLYRTEHMLTISVNLQGSKSVLLSRSI